MDSCLTAAHLMAQRLMVCGSHGCTSLLVLLLLCTEAFHTTKQNIYCIRVCHIWEWFLEHLSTMSDQGLLTGKQAYLKVLKLITFVFWASGFIQRQCISSGDPCSPQRASFPSSDILIPFHLCKWETGSVGSLPQSSSNCVALQPSCPLCLQLCSGELSNTHSSITTAGHPTAVYLSVVRHLAPCFALYLIGSWDLTSVRQFIFAHNFI